MTNNPAERRKYPRFATQIRLQGTSSDDAVEVQMVTENLSMGGLYCRSNIDIPEMTRLAVSLSLPVPLVGGGGSEQHQVELEAVVVRREQLRDSVGQPGYRLALFFTRMDDRASDLLTRYLAGLKK